MLPPEFTPDLLRRLELFKLHARRAFLGTRQGGHISLKRGHGIEFSDYRQYELGDNPRHIDWGVFARSDRLYIKTFQEEQDVPLWILIDPSRSMHVPPEEKKWEMSRDIALALAYVALMSHDSVSLAVPGLFVRSSYYGARAIHALAAELLTLDDKFTAEFGDSLRAVVNQIKFPGLAVIISDFLMPLTEIERAITMLRAKNLDITAIQVLAPHDCNPGIGRQEVIAIDSETAEEIDLTFDEPSLREYAEVFDLHQFKLQKFLTDSRVSFTSIVSDMPLVDVIIEKLPVTGLLR